MRKMLVLGIDSMDSGLVKTFINELPNIRRLCSEGQVVPLRSVFPPDSDTAWASIYSGQNPASHGVISFVDPLKKSMSLQTTEMDAEAVKGKTFWDILGKSGSVCVLLPHLCYPPWPVNGFMVSRSRVHNKVELTANCSSLCDIDFNLNDLNTPKGVPKTDENSLDSLILSYEKLLMSEADYFLKMQKSKDWDLFFCYSSVLDSVQHYFWDHLVSNNSKYSDVIKKFYIMYDDLIGKLLYNISSDTSVMILSDHGHGGRPKQTVNINGILWTHGYLKKKKNIRYHAAKDYLFSIAAKIVSDYSLGWVASKLLQKSPKIKGYCSLSHLIDFNSSVAYITDLSGIKSYTYGGVIINRCLIGANYEQTRDDIISLLKHELDGMYVWIQKREDLYSGQYVDKYPDILIQLKEDYGLGARINNELISRTYTTNIVPGSHKGDTPVLILYNFKSLDIIEPLSLMDIYSIILDNAVNSGT
jgi:predicted AlkP superfamily phosphohydrolase/phosphomutase